MNGDEKSLILNDTEFAVKGGGMENLYEKNDFLER
jgi:hypothetical protein